MKINVASTNPAKVKAVEEVIKGYKKFKNASINSLKVNSRVPEQPKSTDETVKGAKNRSRTAFKNCDLAIGLESGLIEVPHTETGFMELTACAIFDGQKFYLGLSPAWEPPEKLVDKINTGMDLNSAAFELKMIPSLNIGSKEGLIGILTKGRTNRKEYSKQAVIMALVNLNLE